jgi:hypothetical protein
MVIGNQKSIKVDSSYLVVSLWVRRILIICGSVKLDNRNQWEFPINRTKEILG